MGYIGVVSDCEIKRKSMIEYCALIKALKGTETNVQKNISNQNSRGSVILIPSQFYGLS